ncbi:unnamed protein product [Ambrosiozyma monospora]|uniref:Unnamed protein product n=1 Tax=Ambrosiozyma monospora TaxID=43982 RepID=A0A9W6YLA7_AMBMO|nr:unnamed protein product [Ambrosiozyma monospora]
MDNQFNEYNTADCGILTPLSCGLQDQSNDDILLDSAFNSNNLFNNTIGSVLVPASFAPGQTNQKLNLRKNFSQETSFLNLCGTNGFNAPTLGFQQDESTAISAHSNFVQNFNSATSSQRSRSASDYDASHSINKQCSWGNNSLDQSLNFRPPASRQIPRSGFTNTFSNNLSVESIPTLFPHCSKSSTKSSSFQGLSSESPHFLGPGLSNRLTPEPNTPQNVHTPRSKSLLPANSKKTVKKKTRSSSSPRANPQNGNSQYRCTYEGCKYTGYFIHPDYLRRHMKEQHQCAKKNTCVGIDEVGNRWGCGKSFTRPHKLRDHWKCAASLRKCHVPDKLLIENAIDKEKVLSDAQERKNNRKPRGPNKKRNQYS